MDRTGAGGREGTGVQHRLRVLLAEDDPLTAALVHHRLARDGFEVHGFDDGLEAFAAVREGRHDLIILDVKLPGMDGFELLERIRALPDTGSIPVVMLTAMGREEDIVRGLRLGAHDYVLKPFSPVELSARVRRLLNA
jgi:DNA-binding response OmpR family regulator